MKKTITTVFILATTLACTKKVTPAHVCEDPTAVFAQNLKGTWMQVGFKKPLFGVNYGWIYTSSGPIITINDSDITEPIETIYQVVSPGVILLDQPTIQIVKVRIADTMIWAYGNDDSLKFVKK